MISNKCYDTIKNVALIAAPILAFLSSLCVIWNVPFAEQVCATIAGIDTLLGALTITLRKLYTGADEPEEPAD